MPSPGRLGDCQQKGDVMTELANLKDPVAVELFGSTEFAHLAYTAINRTPRVVPVWFHWNGSEVVMASPLRAPKVKALQADPHVAVTIDGTAWPYHALMLRGTVSVQLVEEVPMEYAAAAPRYFGPEQGPAWVAQVEARKLGWARIAMAPTWCAILDFETRFPSALT
jgi:Pyridoxamine 5'-phosphate oxidase